MAANSDKLNLRCAIRDVRYEPHAGAAHGIDCSPFQRQLFLTCGADGSVRLYHMLKQQPLLIVMPCSAHLYAVQWSPSRPLVFAAAAADGRVYFYDLLRSRGDLVLPVLSLDAAASAGRPIHGMAFNPKSPAVFATADGPCIRVWQLPPYLEAAARGEAALLAKLAAADDAYEVLKR